MSNDVFIGIEIGGSKIQMVVGDADARIVKRGGFKVDRDAGAQRIRSLIEAGLAGLMVHVPGKLVAAGVGFGGPINPATGRIARSHQIRGWEDFPLQQWIAERLGLPVSVENDSNTAALGEALSGSGADLKAVFYTNFGSGVGGGLIVDREIYHGAPPGEMEFGHIRLDRGGATVESKCSGWSVDKRIRELAREAEGRGHLSKLIGRTFEGEAKHLPAALAAGDPMAQRVLDEVAGDIGFALSHVVHLLHPDIIVLGGGLSLVGEPFRSAVEAAMRPNIMEAFAPGPPVALAKHGEDVVTIGALHLAIRAASCDDTTQA